MDKTYWGQALLQGVGLSEVKGRAGTIVEVLQVVLWGGTGGEVLGS